MGLPLCQAFPQVLLDTGGGLVAFLGSLGQEFHDDRGQHLGNGLDPFGRRLRFFCDVAVHPLDGVQGHEWQRTREHFIEGDTKGIKVAAQVDRAIHPPCLLRRHVGQCARDGLQGLAFTGQPRSKAKARQPSATIGAVHQDMRRLDVFVHEAALVQLAQRLGDADGQMQKRHGVHGRIQQLEQWRAARILQQQMHPPVFPDHLQWAHGPCAVQLVLEGELVSETAKARR
ncbi:hypothetical protein D3C73_735630 [compost metagenome]